MNFSIQTGEQLFQFILLVVLIIFAIILLGLVINVFLTAQAILYKKAGIETKAFSLDSFWKKIKGEVPMEMESELLMDHDYDGIHELDNHLPPWWLGMFYAGIVFAVVYMFNYHVWKWSPLQTEEYEIAMNEAAEEKALAQQNSPETTIDESAVELITDETQITRGKTIYDGNCAVCHGNLGEGGVGPNLTDEFWLHGGDVSSIYQTVKYGIPEKGMISWEATLKPVDMQQVSSYIITLQGTNPPNGKAAQGDKYTPEEATAEPAEAEEVL
ncbi:cbb3-type cytochrome c oxidase N-terminal domain-containing protein [uncultured Arcticibacterium sp.]|uniref:cbb3-type cytochrome c oxidase N-terminal domain-containing protein n=1 Tax=uncultured Arcticibacterium sp. TaxID=2173042 RepID=UPI0030FB4408